MSFSIGDVVRVGKGKVEWTIVDNTRGTNELESSKGATRCAAAVELTLIHAKKVSKPVKLVRGKRGGKIRVR